MLANAKCAEGKNYWEREKGVVPEEQHCARLSSLVFVVVAALSYVCWSVE